MPGDAGHLGEEGGKVPLAGWQMGQVVSLRKVGSPQLDRMHPPYGSGQAG